MNEQIVVATGYQNLLIVLIILFAIIAVVVAIKSLLSGETSIGTEQLNKVVVVSLVGGLIGLFFASPQGALNTKIKKENGAGWKVIQVIPSESGNIFLFIFRLFLLILTFFLFTTTNGYYIIMEKSK